jgi:hypothetical protein
VHLNRKTVTISKKPDFSTASVEIGRFLAHSSGSYQIRASQRRS